MYQYIFLFLASTSHVRYVAISIRWIGYPISERLLVGTDYVKNN
ncbi:MAG: hypothetical protein NVSMB27_11590 [Ktedonobacteraceae bacterium]